MFFFYKGCYGFNMNDNFILKKGNREVKSYFLHRKNEFAKKCSTSLFHI